MMDRMFLPIPLHEKERIGSALIGLRPPVGYSILVFIDFEIPQLLFLFALINTPCYAADKYDDSMDLRTCVT